MILRPYQDVAVNSAIKSLNKHGIRFDFNKSKRIYNYLNKVNREEVKK